MDGFIGSSETQGVGGDLFAPEMLYHAAIRRYGEQWHSLLLVGGIHCICTALRESVSLFILRRSCSCLAFRVCGLLLGRLMCDIGLLFDVLSMRP